MKNKTAQELQVILRNKATELKVASDFDKALREYKALIKSVRELGFSIGYNRSEDAVVVW